MCVVCEWMVDGSTHLGAAVVDVAVALVAVAEHDVARRALHRASHALRKSKVLDQQREVLSEGTTKATNGKNKQQVGGCTRAFGVIRCSRR